MTTWVSTYPNLIPVDPAGGGLGRYIGWTDPTDTVVTTPGDGTLVLPRDSWVTSGSVAGGVSAARIPVSAGVDYTAATTADGFVAVSLLWVLEDGTVVYDSTATGIGRVAVTGTAPRYAAGAVVEISAPTVRVTTAGTLQYSVSYQNRTQSSPNSFSADPTGGTGPITLTSPVLVAALTDPGALDPTILDTTWGTRVYRYLPEIHRRMDSQDTSTAAGRPLQKFLQGMGAVPDIVSLYRDDIAAGALTDPNMVPDPWVPWLAQALGVTPSPSISFRDLITAKTRAPVTSTRAAIAALCRPYLTGSQVADVVPSTTPWTLVIRVRADEVAGVTAPGLRAVLLNSGQIPAGFDVQVTNATIPWSAITGLGPKWADQDAQKTWAQKDSTGVVGI